MSSDVGILESRPTQSSPRPSPAGTARRVLFISFDFPPRRTSAVYRHAGLMKYIGRFGWQPTVLTVREIAGDTQDRELLEKIPPQVEVVRTRTLRVAAWMRTGASAARKLGALRSSPDRAQAPWFDRFLRWAGDLLRSIVCFPDDSVGWLPFGLARAIQLHRRRPFDAIYTSSPPKTAPVIGMMLKALLGVPWVAEFRDPWYPPARPLRRRLERGLLRLMLARADVVVVISRGFALELQTSYAVPAEKLAVIPNGFDEDDFREPPALPANLLPPGYLHLSHFGTVYQNFSGEFFPALAQLVEEKPELKARLRVNIIGFPDDTVSQYANQGPLQEVIRLHGFLNHADAIAAMRASHWLLLFLAQPQVARLSGLGKIYEYLRVGRPVLALSYEGGVQELVEQAQAGWVLNPEDTAAIKGALVRVANSTNHGRPGPATPNFLSQFRYEQLAAAVSEVLNKVVRHDG